MKKILLSLLTLIVFAGIATAETVSVTFSELGYTDAQPVTSLEVNDDITISFEKGSNSNTPKYYNTGTGIRLYGGNTMTITAAEGVTITEAVFSTPTGSYAFNSASKYSAGTFSINGGTATWTGEENTFTITQGGTSGHVRIQKVSITYSKPTSTKTPVTLSWSESSVKTLLGGIFTAPTLTVDPAEAADAVVYSSSNAEVAEIDATTGAVEIKGEGTTTITASIPVDNETYKSVSASYTLNVAENGYIALFGRAYNSKSISSYTATWSATNNGFTWNIANFNNNNNGWEYIKAGRKGATSIATITTATPIPDAVNKIVMTVDNITSSKVNSINLLISKNEDFSTPISTISVDKNSGDVEINIAKPGKNLYYQLVFDCASGSDNGLIQISKIKYNTVELVEKTEATLSWSAQSADVIKGSESNTFPTLSVDIEDAASLVVYSSSNTDVAEIDATTGEITLKSQGTTTITADIPETDLTYSAYPVSYTLNVFAPAEYTLPSTAVSISAGGVRKINLGENYPESITFTTADETIATVEKEENMVTVTGVAHGETDINVAWDGDKYFTAGTAVVKVTVTLLDYAIENSEITLQRTQTAKIELGEEHPEEIIFLSDDENIATVDDEGNITGVAVGETNIIVAWDEDNSFNAGETTIKVIVTDKTKEILGYTALFGADYNSKKISSYTDSWTATNEGFTWDIVNFNNNNNSWDYIKAGRKDYTSIAKITTSESIPEAISKVVMTVDDVKAEKIKYIRLRTSATPFTADDKPESEILSIVYVDAATGDLEFILDNPQENLYYQIGISCDKGSNGLIQVSKVCYYYEKIIPETKAEVHLSWILYEETVEKTEIILGDEEFTYPTLTVEPEEAISDVIYTSSNTEVAEIDENGVITPKSHGTTKITATIAKDNEFYTAEPVSYTLSVNDPKVVILDATTLNIKSGSTNFSVKKFYDAPNDITYTAVCNSNNSGIGLNRTSAEGKASSIVVSDNNHLGRTIKSVTIAVNSGTYNIYGKNKNFKAPTVNATSAYTDEEADLLCEAVGAGTYDINCSAFAIVPAKNDAMSIKSIRVIYNDEYVCHFDEEELTPEYTSMTIDTENKIATITFEVEKSHGKTIHFKHTPAAPAEISLMAVDHGDFTQAAVTEGEGTTDTHTITVNEAGNLTYYGFHTASETKGVERSINVTDDTLTGVEGVAVDNIDSDAVYYNLNGVRVDAENLIPGVYVRLKGSKSEKVVIR